MIFLKCIVHSNPLMIVALAVARHGQYPRCHGCRDHDVTWALLKLLPDEVCSWAVPRCLGLLVRKISATLAPSSAWDNMDQNRCCVVGGLGTWGLPVSQRFPPLGKIATDNSIHVCGEWYLPLDPTRMVSWHLLPFAAIVFLYVMFTCLPCNSFKVLRPNARFRLGSALNHPWSHEQCPVWG